MNNKDLYTSAIRELLQTSSKAGLLSPDSVSVGFSIHFFDKGWENSVIIWERNEKMKQALVYQLSQVSRGLLTENYERKLIQRNSCTIITVSIISLLESINYL